MEKISSSELASLVGEQKSKEIIKLTKQYEKQTNSFKNKINSLLSDHDVEVLFGFKFQNKKK